MEVEIPAAKIEIEDGVRRHKLKALLALYEPEQVCKMVQLTMDELMAIIKPKPTNRINRMFEQTCCPKCKQIILGPDVMFDPEDDREKERYGFCVWCLTPLLFRVRSTGPIIAETVPEVIKVGNDDGSIIGNICSCSHVGVQLAGPIIARKINNQWEVRAPMAMMGQLNFASSDGANAFDPNYRDNYVSGKGSTINEALEEMKKELHGMSDSLFA